MNQVVLKVLQFVGPTILGGFLGWGLNQFSLARDNKPKLCFTLVGTPDEELIEKEYRTKTSLSEYSIEIHNIGKSSIILDSFQLYQKKKLLIDCIIPEGERVLHPFHQVKYTLMEQEAEALDRYYKKYKLSSCAIIAKSLDNKQVKGKLNISWVSLRCSVTDGANLIVEREGE